MKLLATGKAGNVRTKVLKQYALVPSKNPAEVPEEVTIARREFPFPFEEGQKADFVVLFKVNGIGMRLVIDDKSKTVVVSRAVDEYDVSNFAIDMMEGTHLRISEVDRQEVVDPVEGGDDDDEDESDTPIFVPVEGK